MKRQNLALLWNERHHEFSIHIWEIGLKKNTLQQELWMTGWLLSIRWSSSSPGPAVCGSDRCEGHHHVDTPWECSDRLPCRRDPRQPARGTRAEAAHQQERLCGSHWPVPRGHLSLQSLRCEPRAGEQASDGRANDQYVLLLTISTPDSPPWLPICGECTANR